MNPQTKSKIHHVPTNKLVVMVDVSKHELTKLLKKQRAETALTEGFEEKLTLWKNRYAVSSTELKRRVNSKFNAIDSKPSVKEVKKAPVVETKIVETKKDSEETGNSEE